MAKKSKTAVVTVTAKCISCGKTRDIGPGDVAPGDHPTCDACFMPLVATEARAVEARPTKSRAASRGALKVGDEVERLDPSSLSHRTKGKVTAVDERRATVGWDSGNTTKVALDAEGKRWRRTGARR